MKLRFTFASLLVLVSCTVQEPAPDTIIPDNQGQESGSYLSGFLYAKLSDGVTVESPEYQDIVSSLGVASVTRLFPDGGPYEKRHRLAGLDRWYLVEYDPDVPRTKAEKDISSLPGVEIVETPYKIKLNSAPFDDPYFSKQWDFYNDGSVTASAKGCDINVLPVWEEFTTGSPDIVVGVLDGGVMLDHPDLDGVVLPPGPGGSRSFKGEDYVITPDNHGTHVAGVIAARNNNSEGICGIAGGSDGSGGVRIMSCQIFNDETRVVEASMPQAFIWAADNGVNILNNSWGYQFYSENDARMSSMPSALKDAIDYFIDYAGTDESGQVQTGPMKGGVVIFAAGNDGWQYAVPASYSRVIAVAAVGPRFASTDYTNYGSWVDICAPGGMMYSPYTTEGGIYSSVLFTKNESGYEYFEGTSMACPHVTGVAALILSYYAGPGFTNEDLKARLIYGANYETASSRTHYIGPALDAYGAMTYQRENALPELSITNSNYDSRGVVLKASEKGTINIKVANGGPGKYEYLECSSDILSCRFNSFGDVEITVDALKFQPGTMTESVKVGFSEDLCSEISFIFTILENRPPVVLDQIDYIIIEDLEARSVVDLKDYFSDPDAESLSYSAAAENDGIVNLRMNGTQLIMDSKTFGETVVKARAKDVCGAVSEMSFKLLVYDASQPVSVGPNPVKDILYISKGGFHKMDVKLFSASGALVYSGSLSGDYFNPASLDLSSCAPGRYTLRVSMGSTVYNTMVIKE